MASSDADVSSGTNIDEAIRPFSDQCEKQVDATVVRGRRLELADGRNDRRAASISNRSQLAEAVTEQLDDGPSRRGGG